MDALNALGLAYRSDDDEEDEEEPQEPPPRQQQQQQHATLPAVSLPPLAAKAGLPDAAALGLPDKDDWEAHAGRKVKKGTRALEHDFVRQI